MRPFALIILQLKAMDVWLLTSSCLQLCRPQKPSPQDPSSIKTEAQEKGQG